MSLRMCNKCEVCKPLTAFGSDLRRVDGVAKTCKSCRYEKLKAWRAINPTAESRYKKSVKGKVRDARHHAKHRAKRIANSAKWRKDNSDKYFAAIARWQATNPQALRVKRRVASSRYRARKLQATPMWADHVAMREYHFAADFLSMITGEWHHVDHVVPLQSKLVCGLHNQFNLQVLTRSANVSKSNRVWPDMP